MLQEMSVQGLPSRTPADTRWLLSYLLCQESHGLAELSAWVTGLCGRSGSAEIALGALTRHRAPGSGSGGVALGKGGGRVRNVGRAQRLGEASACLSVSPSLSLSPFLSLPPSISHSLSSNGCVMATLPHRPSQWGWLAVSWRSGLGGTGAGPTLSGAEPLARGHARGAEERRQGLSPRSARPGFSIPQSDFANPETLETQPLPSAKRSRCCRGS